MIYEISNRQLYIYIKLQLWDRESVLFGEARFLKLISNRSNPAADLFTGAMITNELEQTISE